MGNTNQLLFMLLHWVVSGIAVMIAAYVVRGFEVKNFFSALIAAAIIGAANSLLWPILIFLTLPINVLTLGLFTFVVNGAILKISAWFVPGFSVKTWGAAIFGSIILSIVGVLLHYALF